MCVHGLGQYYLIVGQHREAGEAFSEAVDIAKEVYGPEDIQVQLKTKMLHNGVVLKSYCCDIDRCHTCVHKINIIFIC